MVVEAAEIFDYLPINKLNQAEQDYIDYLWESFLVLASSASDYAVKYAVFPFHLLFILAIHYKILRIVKANNDNYELSLIWLQCRDKNKLYNPDNPFVFSVINERNLFQIMKQVGASEELIKRVVTLVDGRNDIAHANGMSESDPEGKIDEYLDVLRELQKLFFEYNDNVYTEWIKEMEPGEAGVNFIQLRLAGDYLCPTDMQEGKLAELEKRLNGEL